MIKKLLRNKLAKNSFIYSLSSFIGLGISFFLLPLYTRILSPELYGIYNNVISIAGVFTIISLLGIDSAIARFYFDYYKNKNDLKEYLGSVFLQVYFIALIITVLAGFFFYFFFKSFNGISFFPYFFLAIISSFLVVPYRVLLQLLRVEEKATKVFYFNIANLFLTVSLNVISLIVLKKGVVGILTASIIINGLFSLISFFYLRYYLKINWNLTNLKNTLKFSLPFLPHDFSNLALRNFDVVFIGMFVSLAESGIYSLGLKIVMIMEIVLISINNTWNPIFQRKAIENPNTFSVVAARLSSFYTLLLLNMLFLINIFGTQVISIFASSKFDDAIKYIPILSFIPLFKGFYFLFTQQVQFTKKMKYMPYSTIASAIFYVILAYLLGYLLKSVGVAIASVLSTFALAVLMGYFGQKAYKIPYDKKILLIIIVYIILLLIYLEVTKTYTGLSIGIGLISLVLFNFIGYRLFGFSKKELSVFHYIQG